ncbi:hypothetical protein ACP4OV_015892 [Aristida adscensionis]
MATPVAPVDAAVRQILFRLPPDDPVLLVSASVVCKPPLLGLIRNTEHLDPRFAPTCSFRPHGADHGGCLVLDSRHGRVLLQDRIAMEFVVWDPTTGDHVSRPGIVHLSVYSSEAGEWSVPRTVELVGDVEIRPPALVGDTLYFICEFGKSILRYDLRGEQQELSVFDGPSIDLCNDGVVLIPMEDGGLGVAGLSDFSINLWSLEAIDPDGVAVWRHLTVIELGSLLPDADSKISPYLIGFAKPPDSNFIFVSTNAGVFMIELQSQFARKVCERDTSDMDFSPIFPLMSFFTPDRSIGRLSSLEMTQ